MNRDIRITFVCIITLMIFAVTVPAGQAATSHEVMLLWPDGAPGAKGADDGDKPTLTIYLPEKEKATGAAVVIFPGGGYGHLAMDHEGDQIARWLNSIGVAGFILKYRPQQQRGRLRSSCAFAGCPACNQDGSQPGGRVGRRSRADRYYRFFGGGTSGIERGHAFPEPIQRAGR